MKYIRKKTVLSYLYDQLTGNFMGFFIGLSASGLVSRFFETRSVKNLWGLTAKKAVVDKETFGALEWIISIVIGFIVFEIFTKVIREWVAQNSQRHKYSFLRWVLRHNLHSGLKPSFAYLNKKRIAVFAAAHNGLSQILNGRSN